MRKILIGIAVLVTIVLGIWTVMGTVDEDKPVISTFPVYPKAQYSGKKTAPGCMNSTSGQPACVETDYTYTSTDTTEKIIQWYVSVKKNGWTFRMSDSPSFDPKISLLNADFNGRLMMLKIRSISSATSEVILISTPK